MFPLRRARFGAALVLVGLLLAPGAAPAALSSRAIVAKLNSERAALGIPKVREVASRSAACRAHDRYARLNRILTHFETPGRPGYSARGNRAARMSVLAGPRSSWARRNPWFNAPIHLSQVYNPGLKGTGAAEVRGYNCLHTYPVSAPNVGAEKVWTLPADGGTVGRAQLAYEAPYPPQQRVGIPATRMTGPYLYVWSASPQGALAGLGPLTRLVSGSLMGPDGPVATKVIDSALLNGLTAAGNGWLLPVRPLKPQATYTATIVVAPRAAGHQLTHSWTFRTTSAVIRG